MRKHLFGDGAHNYNKKGNPPTGVCKGQVTIHEKTPVIYLEL